MEATLFNSDTPTRAELPTTRQLVRSTVIAILVAAAILVTIVLPAEYAIDPTGIGRMLKLTDMGEIKQQLAAEAAADRSQDRAPPMAPSDRRSSLARTIAALLMPGPAMAQSAGRNDEISFVLRPGEGVEYKMTMVKDARVEFSWSAAGGVVNYDMHGTSSGSSKEVSYKSGRGVPSDSGVLVAGAEGSHGWFWRNRGQEPVTIALRVSGAYSGIRRAN